MEKEQFIKEFNQELEGLNENELKIANHSIEGNILDIQLQGEQSAYKGIAKNYQRI